MLATIKTIFACLLAFIILNGCDYTPPEVSATSSDVDTYSPTHSVQCGPNTCGPTDVCCFNPTNPAQSKCTTESDCKDTPIACDGAEDCTIDAVCCGKRKMMGDPVSGSACMISCAHPNVRMCRFATSSTSCFVGTECVQMPELPMGFGSCQSTP
jgi:hypothetical protein